MENYSDILSVVSIGISAIGIILGVVNHKRVRSNCCGRKGELSIDIENTTPTEPKKVVLEEISTH